MNPETPRSADAFTIRNVDPADQDQWAALYRQYAAFYRAAMDDEILRRTWSWLMRPEHPEEGIVAQTESGELVGLAHYRSFPKPLLGRDAGFLDDLYVADKHRGQGLGRGLIAAVASIAHARGWPLVRWITAHDNRPARRLYDGVSQATEWITYDLKPGGYRKPGGLA
ncbi:MAG: N-acetyltransferase family protein [Achromobacter sp.]|uniref:GNAT family N-acetyltransferase n=1 Tax=Achromobacter sp. TaxID=134375 RepID=UPI003CFBEC30